MREFNNFEKAVITALVEARHSNDIVNLCAANYIMDATGCYAIEWNTKVSYEKAVFFCKDTDAPISVIFGGLDVLSLFKYLEDNGYLLVMQQSNISSDPYRLYSKKKYTYENGVYWQKMEGNSKAVILGSEQILNTDVALLLDKYAHSIVYPTTELELYVKRGFKTQEDVKFRKEQIISWIGIIIAWVSSIYAVCQSTQPIKIADNQLNQIEAIIKESKTDIPNIVDVQIVNDTLDVNIKESVRLNTRSHITNMPKP